MAGVDQKTFIVLHGLKFWDRQNNIWENGLVFFLKIQKTLHSVAMFKYEILILSQFKCL